MSYRGVILSDGIALLDKIMHWDTSISVASQTL
jgi:hypothetical protein